MSDKTTEVQKKALKKAEIPSEGQLLRSKVEFALPLPKSWNGSPARKGTHRVQKKAPFKPGVQFKANPQLISQIPRAVLLTPSSSDNSVTASISNGSVATYVVTPRKMVSIKEPLVQTTVKAEAIKTIATTTAIPLPGYLKLQRQRTEAILKFRSRKSLSQMDFKEARRTGNFPLPKALIGSKSQALVPLQAQQCQLTANLVSLQQSELDAGPFSLLESYFGAAVPVDMHTASLRIFNTIMLHAWRKRREEVRLLSDQINDLKNANIKNKNQLHVYNSLFRVEQRRNEQLNVQLRSVYQDIEAARSSIDVLQNENKKLKMEEDVLRQQLFEKFQECESLSSILEATKADLFQTMTKERETLAALTNAQRDIQVFESEQAELKQKLTEMSEVFENSSEDLLAIVKERELALAVVKEELSDCVNFELECKKKEEQLMIAQKNEENLQCQLNLLQSEVHTLQQCLAATLGNRLKNCFNHKVSYQLATYQMLHWFAYYMLPATPPPRVTALPVGVAIKRVKAFFSTNSRSN